MMMFDTNTCIYAMKGYPGFAPKVPMLDCSISIVVLGELEYGVARSQHVERNRVALDAFLNAIRLYSLEAAAGEHYGRIRAHLTAQGQLIGNNDMWIAAHALATGSTLVTHNMSEFSRVPELVVDDWMT